MTEILEKHVLSNGMVILAEPIEGVASVAFNFLLPAGAATLPADTCGAASVITDWIFRGAGAMTSRQLVDAMDALGLHRDSSVSATHIAISAAMEASNLRQALELHADVILHPALADDQFELSRQLAIHDIAGLDDDPRQKVMLCLSEQFYPDPWGRPAIGKMEHLQNLTRDRTAQIIDDGFDISRTILSVAGKYDFDAICRQAETLFASQPPKTVKGLETGQKGDRYTHIQHDGAQVHIGLMTEAPPITTDDYYNANVAVSVLSGGMSSRLFTEVREKRGLCYAVGARYTTLKDLAGIRCYAGTTPDKAQETLTVVRHEFDRLTDGITDCEMQRAKVGLKSSLIMQSESSIARAGGIASDYFLLGRVRTLEEIKQKLEDTTADTVLDYLRRNPFSDYTIVTIGPRKIDC